MTIICAMHEAGVGTWIASDSWATQDGGMFVGHSKKWKFVDGGAIGTAGAGVLGTYIREHADQFPAACTATEFYRKVRPFLDEFGFKPEAKDGHAPWYDFGAIIATPDSVRSICGSGACLEFGHRQFASRGSGAYHADGAAWALLKTDASAQFVVTTAVEAAIAHGYGCGGEVYVQCLRAA